MNFKFETVPSGDFSHITSPTGLTIAWVIDHKVADMFCDFLNHLTQKGYPVEILFEEDSISDDKDIYNLEEHI
jgi:hypothetical protein